MLRRDLGNYLDCSPDNTIYDLIQQLTTKE